MVSRATRDGVPMETILARLREQGASEIESIRALCDGTDLSVTDAKRTLYFSATWADSRERIERDLDDVMRALGEEAP
jgi:hypothetical protein